VLNLWASLTACSFIVNVHKPDLYRGTFWATQKVRTAIGMDLRGEFGAFRRMDGHPVWLFSGVRRLVNKIFTHLATIISAQQKPVCFAPHHLEAIG
jgi:hypothetical protein